MGRDSILNEAEKKEEESTSDGDQDVSDEERVQTTFRTSKSRKEELDNLADDLGMSTNALLNLFVNDGIEKYR